MQALIAIQWNPSNPDTNRTEENFHVSEVSLFQGLRFARKTCSWGIFREVSSFSGIALERGSTVC